MSNKLLPSTRERPHLANLCNQCGIALMVCLPFLVPFADARNIDMQGLILLLAGLASWLAVFLNHWSPIRTMGKVEKLLLAGFIVFCLLSLVANPHPGYDFFGAPYIRLGTGGILACIGCGFALQKISSKRLVIYLYRFICLRCYFRTLCMAKVAHATSSGRDFLASRYFSGLYGLRAAPWPSGYE